MPETAIMDQDDPKNKIKWRQMLTIVNLSIRRYLFTRYMWVLFMLGIIPLFFAAWMFIVFLLKRTGGGAVIPPLSDLNRIFQMMFRMFYIHFIIFFVANIFGFSLLRKEVDDRTLHYLLLQPVSKTVVILSKYIGFLVVTWTYLSATFLLTYVFLYLPYGLKTLSEDLFEKRRIITLFLECLVMLAALGLYGAISMVMGTIFKTGWYGMIFLMWETALPYLPSTMKFFTVSHYLQAMTPEKSALPPQMFELYGEMPGPLQSIITLTILMGVLFGITVFLIRRYECRYSET